MRTLGDLSGLGDLLQGVHPLAFWGFCVHEMHDGESLLGGPENDAQVALLTVLTYSASQVEDCGGGGNQQQCD